MAAPNVSSDEILKKTSEIPDRGIGQQTSIKTEDVDKLEIDLSVKCRGCFVEDPEMHYLFTIFDQQLSLADILMQTSTFECKEDDGLPPYLCTKCTTCLIDFFNFKIQFQKTDIYVRTLLGKHIATPETVTIKDEHLVDSGSESQDMENSVDIEVNDIENSHPSELYENIKQSNEPTKFVPDIEIIAGAQTNCQLCNSSYETPDEYQTHMAKDHGKNPWHKYYLFRKMIAENEKAKVQARRKRKYLEADIQDKIMMNMPGKLCRICRVKLPEEEFKVHWEAHKVHVCEECGHRFIKKSDLDIHKQCVHCDVRNFTCDLCQRAFKTKQLLKRHQVVHLNPRSYCCDSCGQRFNCCGTLKTHIQLKHVGTRDFICPICGLAFPMKATLDKHILRHNKNRPPSFYCDICSSAFKDKSSLKRHHLVKHTNDFKRPECEHCGKTYCSNTKLKYHIQRFHSGNVVHRKKRGPKSNKIKEEYNSSEDIDSESSTSSYEVTERRGPKVRNVSADFYKRSPSYASAQQDDTLDCEEGALYVSEEESESDDTESE